MAVTDWKRIRKDFAVTENLVYFLSAAMSPPPRPVHEEIVRRYERFFHFGDIDWEEDLERRGRLLAGLAGMLACQAADLTFVANTSTAMATIARSFAERGPKGANVVSLEDEFPASTVAFEHLGIPMRYVPPVRSRYSAEAILEATDGATLAVVASHVQYATGFRLALEPLGRELRRRGILFIVNATQSFPFYPPDVSRAAISAMSVSLHKWGMAGHVGALFYTSAAFRERFPAPAAGWLGIAGPGIHTEKNTPFLLHDSAAQYDLGTSNLQPLLALPAALEYLAGIGLENIRARILELTDRLIAGLRRQGIAVATPADTPDERSAIVSFTVPGDAGELVRALAGRGIQVSLRRGLVRAAVNVFNDSGDIDALLAALAELLPRG